MDAKKVLYNLTYVVLMRRYGADEGHHYIVGVFNDKALAEQRAEEERQDRAGKYEYAIFAFEMNQYHGNLEEHGLIVKGSNEDIQLTMNNRKAVLDDEVLFSIYHHGQTKQQLIEEEYRAKRHLKGIQGKLKICRENERKAIQKIK